MRSSVMSPLTSRRVTAAKMPGSDPGSCTPQIATSFNNNQQPVLYQPDDGWPADHPVGLYEAVPDR